MGRRKETHASHSMSGRQDASADRPFDEWTRWRPRPNPVFLGLTLALLVAWIGFLLAMIALK